MTSRSLLPDPRRLAVPALVVGLLAGRATPAQESVEAEALLSRAVVLHQSGDLEGAAALYVQVLRAFPEAARIRSNLGAAYAGLGRYDEATEQYRRALLTEDDASIRKNLALSLQKAGRTGEAAEEAARLLASDPANRDALLLLADCRLRLGENQAAVDLLAPAAAAAPDDKAVAFLLGTALLELGRPGDAQVVMDRVFRDDSPEAHLLMGLLHTKKQDWTAARAELEKARAANPSLPGLNFLLGQALLKEMDWAGARAGFEAELRIDPNHFESNLLLGNLLREEGRTKEALEYLERAGRVRPDDLALQFSTGAACLAAGRLDEARGRLEQVAVAAPSHLPTQAQLAMLYARTGEKEKAAAARARAVALQKEADARSFQGAGDVMRDLIGKSSPSEPRTP
jgi:tetratricopeptide (TPR) repeat protein